MKCSLTSIHCFDWKLDKKKFAFDCLNISKLFMVHKQRPFIATGWYFLDFDDCCLILPQKIDGGCLMESKEIPKLHKSAL